MAEVDYIFATARDAREGMFRVTCVVEDTQFTTDPRGRWSPKVVAVRTTNTSNQRGVGVWQSNNGAWNSHVVEPGDPGTESRISPARQEFYHQWAMTAEARWG